MMFVVDANVIFSFLIKQGKTSELLSDLSLEFHCPEYLFKEIKNHKQEILSKTHRIEEEFNNILQSIRAIIQITSDEDIQEYLETAKQISPDPDDSIYFALALKLNCPIWSNDKLLKQQDKIKIYSTKDLIRELRS